MAISQRESVLNLSLRESIPDTSPFLLISPCVLRSKKISASAKRSMADQRSANTNHFDKRSSTSVSSMPMSAIVSPMSGLLVTSAIHSETASTSCLNEMGCYHEPTVKVFPTPGGPAFKSIEILG